MKAVISKIDLVNLIGKIQSIVAAKPAIPILSNVLIEAIDDQLIVSATDLTVSMRCYVEAKVVEEGSIALPARRFFQLVRELTSPQVKISAQTSETAEITTGTSVFKINGMNKAEFPTLPDLAGSPEITLTSSDLKEMFSKTAFSAAREDSRYMLNGVQVQIANQKATFIGTDGKRLAKSFANVAIDPSVTGTYVIPLKAVEEMIKMLDDSDAEVHLTLAHDKISLESGHLTLITKLLSGQYPDVERVIPAKLNQNFSIHREELMSLLKQISLFTSETSSSVRFSFETGQLHLAAMSSDIGEGRVSMPVDYAGPTLEIAFNPYFFLDILRHSKDETVRFGLNDPHNPGLITDSTQALFVIMPMRLNDAPAPRKEAETSVS
ncbi:MAG: DNA polymerase III subunit beta [Chlamydiae bacterium CG10_big_fil_rev_8_21_14_0_10_42_34]|nr:MAG: DNA polymerase III subunit beta [Chlamydiae bacterium CG10_big_fil_rev_8_21_14_0_10_42_34]